MKKKIKARRAGSAKPGAEAQEEIREEAHEDTSVPTPPPPKKETVAAASLPGAGLSLGQKRVRITFNPATSERGGGVADMVRAIKSKSAELIDLCEGLKSNDPRLASLAQTAYEEAAMWAVKAATAVQGE